MERDAPPRHLENVLNAGRPAMRTVAKWSPHLRGQTLISACPRHGKVRTNPPVVRRGVGVRCTARSQTGESRGLTLIAVGALTACGYLVAAPRGQEVDPNQGERSGDPEKEGVPETHARAPSLFGRRLSGGQTPPVPPSHVHGRAVLIRRHRVTGGSLSSVRPAPLRRPTARRRPASPVLQSVRAS